jgi:hypothetical protein
MVLHVFVFLLVVCLLLASFAALARFPGSIFGLAPHEEGPSAASSTVCGTAPLPRRLSRLSSRLHSLVGWRASACSCATLARGEKPAGSPQASEHRGFCLSQSAVRVLRDHRCAHPCAGRGWQAWPGRAHPDLSRPCLPHYLQRAAPYPLVSSENSLSPDWNGALCTRRRARPLRRRAGLRLPSGYDHHLAVPRWTARSKLPRALFLSSPASISPIG